MVLKIAYDLDSRIINKTVRNIKTTSNNLVKRVLAEETTYTDECKKLMKYGEEEFYQKRDELVDALNLYEFHCSIDKQEKRNLNYKLLHSELKELRNKKLKWDSGAIGGFAGAVGLVTLGIVGLEIMSFALYFFSMLGGIGSFVAGIGSLAERPDMGSYLIHHVALRSYAYILKKSENADDFMHDIPFLKEICPTDYKKSDIDRMYKNNAKEFIDYFSSLKNVKEKKKILALVYSSKHKNEEVISWLDTNEPDLVRDVGLEDL